MSGFCPTPQVIARKRVNHQEEALEVDFLTEVEGNTARLRERVRWRQGFKVAQKTQNDRLVEIIEDYRQWWDMVTPDMLLDAIRLEHYNYAGDPVEKDQEITG
jgi:hypothetical protein